MAFAQLFPKSTRKSAPTTLRQIRQSDEFVKKNNIFLSSVFYILYCEKENKQKG